MNEQNNRAQNPNNKGTKRNSGFIYLIIDIILIGFLYMGYVGIIQTSDLIDFTRTRILITIFFHFFFFLFLLAFYQVAFTNPGSVPPNWGFYMGDHPKRRRYCIVCNVWKPDRTHHCSVCGRCVLTMDHHCPWINNCVGFYNRKFFIQLLIYTPICILFILFHSIQYLCSVSVSTNDIEELSGCEVFKYIYVCMMVFMCLVLEFTIIPFLKFHLMLMTKNLTTIEHLDVKNRKRSKYDLGIRRNVSQVLGENWLFWLVPCRLKAGRPLGDGVRWNLDYNSADEDE